MPLPNTQPVFTTSGSDYLSLGEAKAYITRGVPTLATLFNDAEVTQLIDVSLLQLEQICARVFRQVSGYQETLYGESILHLTVFPFTSVTVFEQRGSDFVPSASANPVSSLQKVFVANKDVHNHFAFVQDGGFAVANFPLELKEALKQLVRYKWLNSEKVLQAVQRFSAAESGDVYRDVLTNKEAEDAFLLGVRKQVENFVKHF